MTSAATARRATSAFACLLVLLLWLEGCATLGKNTVLINPRTDARLAIWLTQGLFLTNVRIGDREVGPFVIDSGASDIFFDSELAKGLMLEVRGEFTDPASKRRTKRATLAALAVGPLTLHNTDVLVVDLSALEHALGERLAGVLGYPFFAQAIVEVDYPHGTVACFDPATYRLSRGDWQPLSLQTNRPIMAARVDGDVGGRFILDTGDNGTVLFDASFAGAYGLGDHRPTRPFQATGADGPYETRLTTIEWFELAGHRFERPAVQFAPATRSAPPGVAGIIGRGLLSRFTVVFNYPELKIALLPSPAQCMTPGLSAAERVAACTQTLAADTLDPAARSAAYRTRGVAYHAQQDYARAIADFDAALALDSTDAAAYTARGVTHTARRAHADAVADFTEALRLQPTSVAAYVQRGIAYRAQKDYARALADFDAALQLNPQSAWAQNNRGLTYYAQKDYARAIAAYDAALQRAPNYAAAYGNRANVYRALKSYARAIADADRALQLNPADAWTHNIRGLTYYAQQDYDRARADYDAALERDPAYIAAYTNRGDAYRATQDYTRALADYNAALHLNPTHGVALAGRGVVAFAQGEFAGGAQDFSQALAARPTHPYTALWRFLAETRAGQAGRAALETAAQQLDLQAWPGPVVALYLGQSTPADVVAAATAADPTHQQGWQCEAAFYVGEHALLAGDAPAAVPFLQTAVTTCSPNFWEAQGAQAELHRLGH